MGSRDTPADEAKNLPEEVVAVLTGRFQKNPPLFYEMRFERVTAHLQSHLDDLAAYDDAGVVCDRLGRGDEAIGWMEKKRVQVDRFDVTRPEVKEQLYRYHANLGTFLAHRWVRKGSDRTTIGQVKNARDEIAKALEINPNALILAREKYQLRVLDWIVDPPKSAGGPDLPNILGLGPSELGELEDPKLADEAVRGLAGVIVLGNAWESVDVFHRGASVALRHDTLGFQRDRNGGRNNLAYLAWLRCRELIDAGKGSMLPDAPKGEDLKGLLPRPDFVEGDALFDPAFVKLRAEADAWQKARTAFMTGRLKEGRHPDSDQDFWKGYTERPAPGMPTKSVPQVYNERLVLRARLALLVLIGLPVLAIVSLVGLRAVRSARARRMKLRLEEEWPYTAP